MKIQNGVIRLNRHNNKMTERPKVGVGILIQNTEGQILVGKRKGSHSPFYSIPGGHLELGESFEVAAKKEVFEETGLVVEDPKVYSVVNNLETYKSENIHAVSVNLFVDKYIGIPEVKEPEKCEGWFWCDPEDLPQPHYEASTLAVRCYLEGRFYY